MRKRYHLLFCMTGFRYARVYSSFYLWTEVPWSVWNDVQEEILSYFGSERGKTIDQEEEETEDEFTHEDELREENDAQLLNSKPCHFQMEWLDNHIKTVLRTG